MILSNSTSTISAQKEKPEGSREYMLQLIKSLEDKIHDIEWEAPYRS